MRGNSGNPVPPFFSDDYYETQFQYQTNAANQLQLFGNINEGYSVDPTNYFGNEHINPMLQCNIQSNEIERISKRQKLQISSNYNAGQDEFDRSAYMPNPNPVSTGLRLSYDHDERNSSATSTSGSRNAAPSFFSSLGDSVTTELHRQQQEMDQLLTRRKDQLVKEVSDMKQKHVASVLSAIKKDISKKLREKDLEIESINRRNMELAERIKITSIESEHWQHKAKSSEQEILLLRNNIQQAISQRKEGVGDNLVDDATSVTKDPQRKKLTCRACKEKEVSVLLIPCRHLCLCDDCHSFINVCPVCQQRKISSLYVKIC